MMKRLFFLVLACLFFAVESFADDWPQWLGPRRDGQWRESGIAAEFPPSGPPLRWRTAIGGGYSGPAVAGGRVFIFDRVDAPKDVHGGKVIATGKPPRNTNFLRRLLPGKERVVCLNEKDGRVLWTHQYDCPYSIAATYAIGPRVTPTVDEDRVYVLGAEGNLICLKVADGQVVWSRDFKRDFRAKTPLWGFSSHPLIDGSKLICMVGGKNATVMAFDKHTGRVLWRAVAAKEPGYAPPTLLPFGGKKQLIVWDSDALRALRPESGKTIWSVPLQPTFAMSIGAPRADGNLLYVMSFSRKSTLVRVRDDGQAAEVVWHGSTRRGIGGVMNTPIIRDGYLYACGQGGKYQCIHLESGEQKWKSYQPSTGDRPASWANVFTVAHEDRYFLANDLGELIIARMTPSGYDERSRARLIKPTHNIGGRTVVWSHPAFANRSVYLRNDKEVRCYSLAAESIGKPRP